MDSILLVEDRADVRQMLMTALERMGYDAVAASTAEEAATRIAQRKFSAVLTDLRLPGGSGMDVLRAAQESDAAMPIVIMTAYGSIADAVAAIREGAFDFIQKPVDLDHLHHLLQRAIERQQLLRENIVLKEEYAQRFGFPRIVGDHPALRAAAAEMQRIAGTDSTVLLLGESGTGKELFARAIHQLSARASRPMLALNCAAIPEQLLENELFGHEKGAFTGANAAKPGKFELAHGGTVFLDEIAELPSGAQGKLLRVLEEHTVDRLGGTQLRPVDVRIIAATNRDLEQAAGEGSFRRDLYYRLAVVPIRIPALRERGDDVLLIAEHLLQRFRQELRKPRLRLAPDAVSGLRAHSWPGNVRELQNLLERAAILYDGEISAAQLGISANVRAVAADAGPTAGSSLPELAAEAVKNVERAKIEATLRECRWNKSAAAEKLGVSYKTLLNKIHSYGLD